MKLSVLHSESSIGFGGQEIRILTEAKWLRDRGCNVAVACQPASRIATESKAAGLPTYAIRMRAAWDLRAAVALGRVLAREEIQVVHTHSSVDSWIGALVARVRRVPLVRTRHISAPIRYGLLYHFPHRVVTSGDHIRDIVAQTGVPPDRIVSIPAGVDVRNFHPGVSGERIRREVGVSGPLIGLVANIRGSKGHQVLLEAMPSIVAGAPGVRALIVGDGIGYGDVSRTVQRRQLTPHVSLFGFRRDIPEIMAALDVLVVPSLRSEGIPQVILQAFAVGTPVVATGAGGIPEVVRSGENGLLVPVGDSATLAHAVLSLLGNPERARAFGRAGFATFRRHEYTLDRAMRVTVEVYEDVRRPTNLELR